MQASVRSINPTALYITVVMPFTNPAFTSAFTSVGKMSISVVKH